MSNQLRFKQMVGKPLSRTGTMRWITQGYRKEEEEEEVKLLKPLCSLLLSGLTDLSSWSWSNIIVPKAVCVYEHQRKVGLMECMNFYFLCRSSRNLQLNCRWFHVWLHEVWSTEVRRHGQSSGTKSPDQKHQRAGFIYNWFGFNLNY